MQTQLQPSNSADRIVNIMLRGGRVTASFRAAVFSASNRSGMSVNEFVLMAAAEKLKADGEAFTGIFRSGDLKTARF